MPNRPIHAARHALILAEAATPDMVRSERAGERVSLLTRSARRASRRARCRRVRRFRPIGTTRRSVQVRQPELATLEGGRVPASPRRAAERGKETA